MATKTRKAPFYNHVDGVPVPSFVTEATWRSALNYEPRDDDVFIVEYPKCGMHWVSAIAAAIYSRGAPFASAVDYYSFAPLLLSTGAEGALTMKRPGVFDVHLPFHRVPWSPRAKYIFVARNPKDCCVSLYHYTKMVSEYKFEDGEFEDIFELFIQGKALFGDYFDMLLSWYEHRNDSNVLFITYEQIKKDNKKAVLDIAEFLGSQYKEALLEDGKMLDDVIYHSSFCYTKQMEAEFIKELMSLPEEALPDSPALHMRWRSLQLNAKEGERRSAPVYRRKGIVGDWKNYFSPEQNERMNDKFQERTKGTELGILWEDDM